jgi:M6 family metalloprotease-like protein
VGDLLFYQAHDGSASLAAVTTANLSNSKIFNPGTFGHWTHIVRRNGQYLFYNRDNGSGAIGGLSASGYQGQTDLGAGSFSSWTHIVNTEPGWLFYDRMSGRAAIGSVQDTWFLHTFHTTGSLSQGSLVEWTHVVADGATVFFYNRHIGSAAIATVSSTGITTNVVFAPGSFGKWTHIVNDGPTVFFYNRDTRAGAIGTFSSSGFKESKRFGRWSFGEWTHIVADGSTLLFYNKDFLSAAIGTLTSTDFKTTATYEQGKLGRWSTIAGSSSCGPEEEELRIAVLLCRYPSPGPSTVFSPDYYRRYLFDLSFDPGVGRFWFDESGGQLRFSGTVSDWLTLSKSPTDPSLNQTATNTHRDLLVTQALADAASAGWKAGDAQAVVIVMAAPDAQGVDAGASGLSFPIDGISRYCAILHGDSIPFVKSHPDNIGNFRNDFNCHEVGHLVGRLNNFNHAFGPGGVYQNPYCIMSAKTYAGVRVPYDIWTPALTRPAEEDTRGPGLSGATRSACGWARKRVISSTDLDNGIELYVAHLADHQTTLPQVLEFPVVTIGALSVFTLEFRSPLAERDQGMTPPTAPALVLCQREGSPFSSNDTWAARSSTFIRALSVTDLSSTLAQPAVLTARILEVSPDEHINGLHGPSWLKLKLTR